MKTRKKKLVWSWILNNSPIFLAGLLFGMFFSLGAIQGNNDGWRSFANYSLVNNNECWKQNVEYFKQSIATPTPIPSYVLGVKDWINTVGDVPLLIRGFRNKTFVVDNFTGRIFVDGNEVYNSAGELKK